MPTFTVIDAHIFSWLSAFILFFIIVRRKTRSTILQRSLHVAYAAIIISGTCLVVTAMDYGQPLLYATKCFLGALLIAAMEGIIAQKQAHKRTAILTALAVLFVVTIAVIGYILPIGYHF